MSTARDTVALHAAGLVVGETQPFPCPFCQAQHENKLYVTKTGDDSALYQCKRASCGVSGALGEHSRDSPILTPTFTPKVFHKPTQELSVEQKNYLFDKYQIKNTRGIKYEPEQDVLVFALKTAAGKEWGIQTKHEWNRRKGVPKCMLYKQRNVPVLHFEPPIGRDTCVLVEDFLSARKLAPIIPTVSLLGTHLSEECALELKKYYSSLLIALDYDAIEKARKMREMWKGLFDINVVLLKQDIKDTKYHTLRQVFGDG